MAKTKSGLGRDFYSLLDDNVLASDKTSAATMLRLSDIEPRKDQPRKNFEQQPLEQQIQNLYAAEEIHSKQDIDSFAQKHHDFTEKLQLSMERALQKSRSKQLKNKPIENLTRCIDLLMEVDPRLFGRLDSEEKESLQAKLNEIANIAATFQKELLE